MVCKVQYIYSIVPIKHTVLLSVCTVAKHLWLKKLNVLFLCTMPVSNKHTVAKNFSNEKLNVLFLCTMYCFY